MKKNTLILLLFFTVLSNGQENYYNDVNLNLTGLSLKDELATKIINTHYRFLSYGQIWLASQATDVNPANSQEVLLVYGWENGTDGDVTNDRTRGINDNGGSVGDWNREHVYSRSLGTPNLGQSGPGSDAHHLRPSDAQRNSSRGNRKFSDATGNSGATSESYIDAGSGNNAFGWYPGDEWKGDTARMMMYMYLRYGERCLPTNVGLGDASATPDEMINLFLQWNAEDPVSDFEKQRNTYHESTTNSESQGNRNPFIDNPRLATRIWDGPEAEDTWGIYTSSDTEAPTVPTGLSASNITTFSVDLSWNTSTDNVGVSSYDVYVDGNLHTNTTNTTITITGLNSNTTYSFAVLAKDVAENKSAQSTAINSTTLIDNEAPTVPTDIVVSNETGTSFIATWSAASDNTAVTGYEIYINGTLNASTDQTTYTITGLSISTTYSVQVLAKDAKDNKSALSTAVNATTTDGSTTTANELFFSEYFEGSFATNKALEIANVTNSPINLNDYSIKRQSNGGRDGEGWENELILSGTIQPSDVYVVINESTTIQNLIDEADFFQPNNSSTNFGAPINFNGNDPVGLFKNGVLIDVIGEFDFGGGNFAKDVTLRRKRGVVSPNTAFDLSTEWDVLNHTSSNDFEDDFGQHSATLNIDSFLLEGFNFFPNPIENILNIKNRNNKSIKKATIYSLLGKEIISFKKPSEKINLELLSKGIYILKLEVEKNTYSIKIIKK